MKARQTIAAVLVLLGGLAALAAPVEVAPAQGTPTIERGRAVYAYWCATCHAPGPGQPGTASLAIRYGGSRPAVLEEREDLTPEAIKLFVRRGVLSMPPFRKTEITDAELDDLAAYLSSRTSTRQAR
jgi:(+)-pinoresinol hydroxylase